MANPQRIRRVPPPVALLVRPFQEFAEREAAGGILLLVCTVIALVWANSPWAQSYSALLHAPFTVGAGTWSFSREFHFWVNDALMAIFFFVVGLEIKRELIAGELASPRKAALPILAALGGVIVPALLYASLNAGGPGARGWGIPMATDIAFAIGAMALLGSRIPVGLKVFLTALAIVDDIAAVVVIAVFYTADLAFGALVLAGLCLIAGFAANRLGVRHPLPYAVIGVVLWISVLQSGVHATIAGVLLAFVIPSRTAINQRAFDMESALHPWVTFLIMPVFALANAGVSLSGEPGRILTEPVTLGVILGLVIGKPLGITFASWLAVRLGLASLPERVSWKQIHGAGWLGGIGFTMSLFVTGLAFTGDTEMTSAKLGILIGSVCAGIAGSAFLIRAARPASAPAA